MAIFNYTEFSGMLNLGVGDFKKPSNELGACKNIQEDVVGILKRVPGYSKATANQVNLASNNVNFLHYYFKPSTNTKYLVAGSNNGTDYTLRYRTESGDWNAMSTSGTYTGKIGAQLSAVNYLDKTFLVGYDYNSSTYLDPATINGTSHYISSGSDSDLTNMPGGRYLVRYRDLLYVLYARVSTTTYPSRAYFSKDPVNMALPSWDTTLNFVEFGQDDGDEITGGASCCDRLIVFKTNSMWSYDETNRKKIADVGCDSYKSIKVINGVLYWANRYGIWRWDGALPQLISGKVQPLFDYIDQSKLSEMVGVDMGFEYRLFIGNITYKGITYTNCWVVFDVRREHYYIRCTYHKPLSATKFVEGGKERIYFGSTTGYAYKQSTYIDRINADDGHEIDYFFITNYLDFSAAQIIKVSPSLYFFSDNCGAMKYAIDKDKRGTFDAELGQIQETNQDTKESSVNGNRLAFKFYGKDKDEPFEFEGFVAEFNGLENY